MFPTSPADYAFYSGAGYAKARRQFAPSTHISGIQPAYLKYLLLCQHGLARALSACRAALSVPVQGVISLCAQEEMFGSDTTPHVAGMADTNVLRYRAIHKFIGYTVRQLKFAFVSYRAVAVGSDSAGPKPAFTRAVSKTFHALFDRMQSAKAVTGAFPTAVMTFLHGRWLPSIGQAASIASEDNQTFAGDVAGRVEFGYAAHVNSPLSRLANPRTLARRGVSSCLIIPYPRLNRRLISQQP